MNREAPGIWMEIGTGVHGAARPVLAADGLKIIVLNFHGVGPVRRAMSDGERERWLDLDFFEAILDLIDDKPNVHLTFDDGNGSDYEVVLPAVLRHGLKATFCVCSGRLDQPTYLSRNQIRELQAQGMTIGSHGVAHISWRRLPPDQLRDELEGSRGALEAVCGLPVETAACPFGDYDRKVLTALHHAGYRTVYTSDGGTCNRTHWLQARTTVTRSLTLSDITRLVQQGVSAWEQSLINVRKFLKRLR